MEYRYPATLEPDEDGRVLVRFADLPEALTDGADLAEALVEAADCLSEALASRIVDGEEIPSPTPTEAGPGQHIISPSPTIALKAALYTALRHRDMTVADLAARLDIDWHQAARLIDPRPASKLTSLAAALGALNCQIHLSVYDPESDSADAIERAQLAVIGRIEKLLTLGEATLRAVQAHGEGATREAILRYLSREFGMTVRPNQLGIALQRHRRAGRLEENRDHRWRLRQEDEAKTS